MPPALLLSPQLAREGAPESAAETAADSAVTSAAENTMPHATMTAQTGDLNHTDTFREKQAAGQARAAGFGALTANTSTPSRSAATGAGAAHTHARKKRPSQGVPQHYRVPASLPPRTYRREAKPAGRCSRPTARQTRTRRRSCTWPQCASRQGCAQEQVHSKPANGA